MVSIKSPGPEGVRIPRRQPRSQTALRKEILHQLDGRETALSRFLHGYLTAALWSTSDDIGTPFDANHGVHDIATASLLSAMAECSRFIRECATDLVHLDDDRNGHNFWLTRNRHGSGFWDETVGTDEAEIAMHQLTHASHVFGEVDRYIGDDRKLHFDNEHRIASEPSE